MEKYCAACIHGVHGDSFELSLFTSRILNKGIYNPKQDTDIDNRKLKKNCNKYKRQVHAYNNTVLHALHK